MRSKAYSTSLEVIARLTGGPNLRPDLSLKVYVKPSLEIVGSAVARSGCSSLPFAPAVWLVATSVRSSALYIVNALARYSPVGSKRSEEHTSELQSQFHLVCRLLLEKKKKTVNRSSCYINNLAQTPS